MFLDIQILSKSTENHILTSVNIYVAMVSLKNLCFFWHESAYIWFFCCFRWKRKTDWPFRNIPGSFDSSHLFSCFDHRNTVDKRIQEKFWPEEEERVPMGWKAPAQACSGWRWRRSTITSSHHLQGCLQNTHRETKCIRKLTITFNVQWTLSFWAFNAMPAQLGIFVWDHTDRATLV